MEYRVGVIREQYIQLLGDLHESVILNQFVYWQVKHKEYDDFILNLIEIHKRNEVKTDLEVSKGWIYKKAEELAEETLLLCSEDTIRRKVISLVEKGYINQRRNPKFKWDKTLQYQVNLLKLEDDLFELGFPCIPTLKPIRDRKNTNEPLILPNPQNAVSRTQIEDSNAQNAVSNTHDAVAIPKTTIKTTKQKITTENLLSFYKDIIDYLNRICNTKYRHTTSKTQSLIKARMNEGFTLDDFKTVIDKKHASWSGTEMEQYLRPETLFGTKFEGYLNEKIKVGGNSATNSEQSKRYSQKGEFDPGF